MKDRTNDIESLALDFLEVASLLERRLDRVLSLRGISFSEYRMLRSIANSHSGALPRVDLANSVGLTPSAVTRALKPLEKLGYVKTTRSERDARQSLAALTRGGKDLLNDAQKLLQGAINGLPMKSWSAAKINELQNRLTELRSS